MAILRPCPLCGPAQPPIHFDEEWWLAVKEGAEQGIANAQAELERLIDQNRAVIAKAERHIQMVNGM
jgi:hypothetical protein